jgi:uncharacterized protein
MARFQAGAPHRCAVAVALWMTAGTMSRPAVADPSFDCSGSLSQTETVICSDDALSQLDIRMAAAYRRALASVSGRDLESMRADQKAWIAQRDACGFDKACIRTAYRDQLAALEAVRPAAAPPPRPAARGDIEEKTVLGHNGSTIEMVKKGSAVEMRYAGVRPGLSVPEGSVLFRGTVGDSGHMQGTAYTFKRGCPPADYKVTGQQTNNRIVLRGPAPVRDSQSCDVVGYDDAAPSSTLVFDIAE